MSSPRGSTLLSGSQSPVSCKSPSRPIGRSPDLVQLLFGPIQILHGAPKLAWSNPKSLESTPCLSGPALATRYWLGLGFGPGLVLVPSLGSPLISSCMLVLIKSSLVPVAPLPGRGRTLGSQVLLIKPLGSGLPKSTGTPQVPANPSSPRQPQ